MTTRRYKAKVLRIGELATRVIEVSALDASMAQADLEQEGWKVLEVWDAQTVVPEEDATLNELRAQIRDLTRLVDERTRRPIWWAFWGAVWAIIAMTIVFWILNWLLVHILRY